MTVPIWRPSLDQLTSFVQEQFKYLLIYIFLSIGETLMTKDDDVEAQKASVVPRNQIADFTNVEKDPLIWEIAGITSHYDPEICKSAAEILGNAIVS